MTNYEDWVGREICFIDDEITPVFEIPCTLAGIDPDIGVSLVFAEDSPWLKEYGFPEGRRGDLLFCMHGPLSPKWKTRPLRGAAKDSYARLFAAWVEILSEGSVVTLADLYRRAEVLAKFNQTSICPFLG